MYESHPWPSYSTGSGKMQSGWSVPDSDGTAFTPMVVLELAPDTNEEAIKWLLSRIRDREQNGGKTYLQLLEVKAHR